MGEFFKLPHCVFFQHTHINSQRTLTGCLTNLTYFFDSIRSHRIRAQSHKTSLLQMTHPIPGCYLSFWPCVYVCMLSHVPLFATLWTVAHQAPLSTEFPRQEYWSGLPFPSPGDLPDTGTDPVLAVRFSTAESPGQPNRVREGLRSHLISLPGKNSLYIILVRYWFI